jgi:hypothetical protein
MKIDEIKIGDLVNTEWGVAQVQSIEGEQARIRLVPEVGDVYVSSAGEAVGVVKKVNSDGTCTMDVTVGGERPVGETIFNPALAGREAKMRFDEMKESRQSVQEQLRVLGL